MGASSAAGVAGEECGLFMADILARLVATVVPAWAVAF